MFNPFQTPRSRVTSSNDAQTTLNSPPKTPPLRLQMDRILTVPINREPMRTLIIQTYFSQVLGHHKRPNANKHLKL
jgi:hypothetical protein